MDSGKGRRDLGQAPGLIGVVDGSGRTFVYIEVRGEDMAWRLTDGPPTSLNIMLLANQRDSGDRWHETSETQRILAAIDCSRQEQTDGAMGWGVVGRVKGCLVAEEHV